MNVTTANLQAALGGISRKEAIRRATDAGAVSIREGNRLLWDVATLPNETQLALTAQLSTSKVQAGAAIPQAFLGTPDKYRHVALLRSSLIARFHEMESSGIRIEQFVEMFNHGSVCSAIHDEFGDLSVKTLYKWIAAFKQTGLDGVTPRYGQAKPGAGSQALTEFEQGVARALWLSQAKPAAAKVARDMKEIYGTTASEDTVRRYLDSIPKHIASFYRDGKSKFEARFHQHIETDPTRYDSMGMVVSDHHTWDFLVSLGGRILRPTITVFVDYRSRKVLSWAHSVNPSTLSITEALVMLVTRYGAPGVLHIDNGKDYRSSYLNGRRVEIKLESHGLSDVQQHEIQGVFAHLGIKVIFALPYHGQSKPVERAFGTFAGDFAKEFPTYVGSNTVTKPEESRLFYRKIGKLEKRDVVIPWEAYVSAWDAYVEHWNATWAHRGKGMEGRTPNEVFFANWRIRKHVSPELLEVALAKTEARVVGRNGVTIGEVRYWAPELRGMVKEKVLVKQSFLQPRRAMVYDFAGRFLCYAEADYFVEGDDVGEITDRVQAVRKRTAEEIAAFAKNLPVLEDGKRGIVDHALAAKGQWAEQAQPESLEIVQVSGGGFELPPAPPALRLSGETKKKVTKGYKSALDDKE